MERPIYIKLAAPLVLITVVLVSLLFVRPQYYKIKKARQTLSSEQAKIEKLKAKVQALEALSEYELSEKANIALKALPAKKDVLQGIAVVSRLASETGVIVDKFSVSPGKISEEEQVTPAKAEDKLSFRLELIGTREQFRAFLERLSEFIPLSDVKKVSLALFEEAGTAEFALELYFSPLPKLPIQPETPLPKLTSQEEETFAQVSRLPYYVSEAVLLPAPGPAGRANPFAF